MTAYNCQPLYETYNVYVSPSSYVFEPSSSTVPALGADSSRSTNEKDVRESLVVDRRSGQISLQVSAAIPVGRDKIITCYGILGMITLSTTDYIVIITQRTPSCRFLTHQIYLASDFRLLPLNPASSSKAILGNPIENELVSLVEQGLKAGSMWFSYGWDLTNTLQRQQAQEDAGNGPSHEPLWKRADERFFWNRFLQDRFINLTESGTDLSRFILPAMFGLIELRSAQINNRDFLFCLIARRSRHRVGTRYFTRGIDKDGNVANFNETEQIVLYDPADDTKSMRGRVDGRERVSFVQIRGSVPVYWAEINNLRYKPDLQIMDKPDTTESYRQHMHQLIDTYGNVHSINLVNQKGYEKPVKEAFETVVNVANNSDHKLAEQTKYIYWDFHTECKGMRFDRVNTLVDDLQNTLLEDGWFHSATPAASGVGSSTGPVQVLNVQKGVMRSNCMDCLDRTNVSQAAFAKWALTQQLRQAGVLSVKETVEDHSDFMPIFRNVWADHADTVSKAYSGSGALKTDYTRTGKRTKEGLLQDGVNSVMRYVKNNFFDGDRQDAYDLVAGAYVVRRGGIPPLSDMRPLLLRSMPYMFVFALTMILAAVTLPRTSEWSIYSLLLLWVALAFVTGSYIWGNGTSYVAWPRLNPPHEILSYEGPGYRGTRRGRGLSITGIIPSGKKGRSTKSRTFDDIELKKKGSLID
ncbi:hypothetical protein CspeluHIS016_0303020 [Cutaneotrichosporon spelunceum]|uniref:SAC domain-containing protein n=1 Tax=Cutaneotrichosporon spelunceum TaxID=1672016 RepID=A0AAD3TT75_9TREE|nr:hypothetical protein CspeluHIS016_0303020 [Cutaneotrichosporon spelunceum]